MVSKRKKPLVRKAASATQEQQKQQQHKRSAEEQIKYNGELVEKLLASEVWTEIVAPVLQESIASVSGRLTNGRYYHGGLTSKWDGTNSLFYAAYQKALMDFSNNIHDFVVAKKQIEDRVRMAKEADTAPLYNPAAEDTDE